MLKEDEVVIHDEGASHFQNFIAVGGRLKLTNMRLLFYSNSSQNLHHELEVEVKEISQVQFFKTLLINPNGMAVMLKDGNIENFIVDDRKAWSERIMLRQTELA